MKYVILILLINCAFAVFGQEKDNRILEIRKMYQATVNDIKNFATQEKDVTWLAFSGDEDAYSKAVATKYFNNQNQLKLIKITYSSSGQLTGFYAKDELYFYNDSIYFIYSKNENSSWEEVYEQKGKTYSASEERVYYNTNGECIRYLTKEIDWTFQNIDSLLFITGNNEIDCMYAKELKERITKYIK